MTFGNRSPLGLALSASLAMHLGAAAYFGWSHRREPLDAVPEPLRVTLVMQPASGTAGEQAVLQTVDRPVEKSPPRAPVAVPQPNPDPVSEEAPDRESEVEPEPEKTPPPEPEQAPAPDFKPARSPAPVDTSPKPKPREASPPKVVSSGRTAPSPAASGPARVDRPALFSGPSLAGISNPKPRYPRQARRRRLEGLVILSVEVGLDGQVASLAVERSSGFAVLDNAARRAVADWRFRPALRGGEPVSAQLEVPVRFRLRDS